MRSIVRPITKIRMELERMVRKRDVWKGTETLRDQVENAFPEFLGRRE
jgi:hypothetical protein